MTADIHDSREASEVNWLHIVCMVVIFVLVLALAHVGYAHDFWSQTMASWVQAFGSIGAIFGAIWLGGQQHRKKVELQNKRDREFRGRLKGAVISIFEPYFQETDGRYQGALQAQGEAGYQGELVTGNATRIRLRTVLEIEKLRELRGAIVHDPLLLLRYVELMIELKYVIEMCEYEERFDQWRRNEDVRNSERMHLSRNSPDMQTDEPCLPVDLTSLGESLHDAKLKFEQFVRDLD